MKMRYPRQLLSRVRHEALASTDALATNLRWRWFRHRRAHLPADARVVVSLTSYPRRFDTLALTLKTLLLQSIRPQAVVLWIAASDVDRLPANVRALCRDGLEIRTCDDLRSYKKLIPALGAFPRHAIVTADDDVVYWRHWLRDLMSQYDASTPEILCHRMHEVRLDASGAPLRYAEWRWCSEKLAGDRLNFATGSGGILYPPGVLDDRVRDISAMLAACPTGDDIWFYWMARLNGARVRKVCSSGEVRFWRGSQDAALWKRNVENHENDSQIAAMHLAFGFPE